MIRSRFATLTAKDSHADKLLQVFLEGIAVHRLCRPRRSKRLITRPDGSNRGCGDGGRDKDITYVEKMEKTATVLVADDDELVRTFVRSALEQVGLQVCEASNGQQALEQFVLRRPDIIVLDVMMPVMDGYTACSRLRGSVGGSRVPILMMTGMDDAEAIAGAYEHGATDFITKPLNHTILSHRVRYMLRGSRTLDALLRSESRLGLAQRIAKIGNW